MAINQNESKIIDSLQFGKSGRKYFLDIKESVTHSRLLQITRSDVIGPNKYQRSSLVLFEEDLECFIEGLCTLLKHISQEKLKDHQDERYQNA
jgi:hypothetical protein